MDDGRAYKSSDLSNSSSQQLMYPKNVLSDMIFESLFNSPFEISTSLRRSVRMYPRDVRRRIVSFYKDEVTPLFLAVTADPVMTAARPENSAVTFLVVECNADVEQKCRYKIREGETTFTNHVVTPLWCAAVSGRLEHCVTLVEAGKANVNSKSDTGSTAVRSACFMNHIDVVRYLVEVGGADVNLANLHGGTCLINSVQNPELCRFLVSEAKAKIDAQDMHGKTALHYAIYETKGDTIKLLLELGADPRLKTQFGDDALQTAALNGAFEVFKHLSCLPNYPRDYVLDEYDLLGACVLDKLHDVTWALDFWRTNLVERLEKDIPKKLCQAKRTCLTDFQLTEFETLAQLEELRNDSELLHLQSLVIYERVLGSQHRETTFRMLYRGAVYADLLEFQKCLFIWIHVFECKLAHDVIYHPDTIFTGKTVCIVLMEMSEKFNRSLSVDKLRMDDIIRLLSATGNALPQALECIKIKPCSAIQEHYFKKVMFNLLYLLNASTNAWMDPDKATDQDFHFKQILCNIVSNVKPITKYGDTLLHLSVDNTSFVYFHPLSIFPSFKVVRMLVEAGSNVNARDAMANTPLHFVSVLQKNVAMIQIYKHLIKNGAHYDSINLSGRLAGIFIPKETWTNPLRNVNFKCLACRVIKKFGIPTNNPKLLPKNLSNYLTLH